MKLPEQSAKNQVLAVTRRNKEVMAVMTWELYEGLLETIEVLSDPDLMIHLKESLKDVNSGKLYSISQAYERLGL